MRHPMAILLGAGLGVVALAACVLALIGGPVPGAATIGGHWSLTRDDGVRVSDRDFHGRYMLMFFGYTACQDVCPTTLASVADAMAELGQDAARVQPVFVTVDPGHDTPPVVHDYVRRFGPALVGLTGTRAEIGTVERRFEIHAEVSRDAVEHDAVLLLVDPDGAYLEALPAAETGHALATRLASAARLSRS